VWKNPNKTRMHKHGKKSRRVSEIDVKEKHMRYHGAIFIKSLSQAVIYLLSFTRIHLRYIIGAFKRISLFAKKKTISAFFFPSFVRGCMYIHIYISPGNKTFALRSLLCILIIIIIQNIYRKNKKRKFHFALANVYRFGEKQLILLHKSDVYWMSNAEGIAGMQHFNHFFCSTYLSIFYFILFFSVFCVYRSSFLTSHFFYQPAFFYLQPIWLYNFFILSLSLLICIFSYFSTEKKNLYAQ
jgi:hypothetical protein